jgi:hypothetical protein
LTTEKNYFGVNAADRWEQWRETATWLLSTFPLTRRASNIRESDVIAKLKELWHSFLKVEHRAVAFVAAKGAAVCHFTYYTLVTAEAHGTYRWAALALAVLMILEKLGGEDQGK